MGCAANGLVVVVAVDMGGVVVVVDVEGVLVVVVEVVVVLVVDAALARTLNEKPEKDTVVAPYHSRLGVSTLGRKMID